MPVKSLKGLSNAAVIVFISGLALFVFAEGESAIKNTAREPGAAKSVSDISTRQAYIVGKAPRIPPLALEQLSEEASADMNKLRAGVSVPAKNEVSDYFATMMRHPDLYKKHMAISLALFNGTLTLRDRELAIIRTAWLCQAPFEFGEHVSIGKRLGGLTDEEIEQLITGSESASWNEHERAVIRVAEELHADAMISDETWTVLSKTLDEQQLIELVMVVGHYQKVAYIQNSLRISLSPENNGLLAR